MMRFLRSAILVATLAASTSATAVSLYDENNFAPLAADRKAFHVGDLITVVVYEQSSATSTADTDATRKGAVNAQAGYNQKSWQASVGVGNQFDGTGRTERTGRVLAQITARVESINAHGDLMLAGDQTVVINDEKQTITLRGTVRPIDISESNIVQSSRLADANISYTGDGVVGSRQKPGLWQHVLSILGL